MTDYTYTRIYLPPGVEEKALLLADLMLSVDWRPVPPEGSNNMHGTSRKVMPPTYKLGHVLAELIELYGDEVVAIVERMKNA